MRSTRRPHRPGWLRRNRVPLLGVVVLLPATLGIMFAYQWLGYFEHWPSKPLAVAAGDSVEYGDSVWRIQSTQRFGADSARGLERNLPQGTDLVVVTVGVDPSGAASSATAPTSAAPGDTASGDTTPGDTDLVDVSGLCTAVLEETGGMDPTRRWTDATGGPVPLAGTGPALTSCNRELRTPYTFDAQFVVPADAGDWTALTLGISVAGELPEYARFSLD